MTIFVPPYVPPMNECDYQVRVKVGVYQCMTKQEYDIYRVSRDQAADNTLPIIFIFVGLVLFIVGSLFRD